VKCLGRNLDDHCCYVNNKPCKYLEENTEEGFRWSCGLRRELGSWDLVHKDPRYIDGPGRVFMSKKMDCGDWPSWEQSCGTCGANR
jgi:hypothetical protein